jgi:hypothetical protein
MLAVPKSCRQFARRIGEQHWHIHVGKLRGWAIGARLCVNGEPIIVMTNGVAVVIEAAIDIPGRNIDLRAIVLESDDPRARSVIHQGPRELQQIVQRAGMHFA